MVGGRLLALTCVAAFIGSCCIPVSMAEDGDDDYALYVAVDDTKVSIISGNLTVAVTRDWPRVVFQHSTDILSPTFDIGFPKMYLFNDTDGDGRYSRSELLHTVYLDSNHVKWNLSSVESRFTPALGEHVSFSMSACADAYNQTLDAPPAIETWAILTFWYYLSERDVEFENPAGAHEVSGKVEMFVNMTVEVVNRTGHEFMAFERLVQGGGSANMLHLLEDGPDGPVSAVLSARVDEGLENETFTRTLNGTSSSTQKIDMAKEDGTVQAFYRWGSTCVDSKVNSTPAQVNSSCYTNGAGLILHSTLPLSNATPSFSLDSSLGIDEDGFVGSMTERVKDLGPVVIAMMVVAVSAVVVVVHMVLRRWRLKSGRRDQQP
jgi:hypothetical protein